MATNEVAAGANGGASENAVHAAKLNASEVSPPAIARKRDTVDKDAVEIGALYARSKTSLVDAVKSAHECGKRLAAKKESLSHGEWLPWLDANEGTLGFSTDRTAQRLMRFANATLTSDLDGPAALLENRKLWGNEPSQQPAEKRRGTEDVARARRDRVATAAPGDIGPMLDPEISAEARKAEYAADEKPAATAADPSTIISDDWKRKHRLGVFIARAKNAAVKFDAAMRIKPTTDDEWRKAINAADDAAAAWTQTAIRLGRLRAEVAPAVPPNDPFAIPDILRRTS